MLKDQKDAKMRTRIIKAKFQGQDGSMGFKKGNEYSLSVTHQGGINMNIWVQFNDIKVEYQSLISFLDNWDNIQVLGEPKVEYHGSKTGFDVKNK